jgi:type I restriction enzyme S subunit
MSAIIRLSPRAFVVRWKDMERWSVGSFVETDWRWPASVIHPLSTALSRKLADVERNGQETGALRLVTLHFDGEMEPRDENAGDNFKGRLFHADPGDVIYSKIDVRNGAIGIIPNEMGRVSVSSEYPVYGVDSAIADARYVKLVFRTDAFRRKINSMISGASGRKRVQPADLESVEVPLPQLSVQRKIVTAWEAARKFAADTAAKIERLEREIEACFLADLGLKAAKQAALPKAFAVQWRDFLRWSVSYNQLVQAGMDIARSKYPLTEVGSLASLIQYGTSEKANTASDGTPVIRMNNLVDGQLDLRNLKHICLNAKETEKLTLLDGDILFNRTNSKELVGKCAVFHEQGQSVFASYLIRVRLDISRANPDFVSFALNSPIGRQQIDALSRQIIGQANVNSEELRSLQIPLPPLPVQQAMMKRVEAGRVEIAKLKADAKARADAAKADVEAMILGTKPVE